MVGVKQFDEQSVSARALDVFWRKGLPATSMLDLARETGVQRGSLYNAYGDKDTLFLLAFDAYAARFLQEAEAALDIDDVRQALQRFFRIAIENMISGSPPRGCLTTKTAVDGSAANSLIRKRLQKLLDDLAVLVEAALSRNARRSRLALPAAEAAEIIVTFTRGLAVMERIYRSPAKLRKIAANLVRIIVLPQAAEMQSASLRQRSPK